MRIQVENQRLLAHSGGGCSGAAAMLHFSSSFRYTSQADKAFESKLLVSPCRSVSLQGVLSARAFKGCPLLVSLLACKMQSWLLGTMDVSNGQLAAAACPMGCIACAGWLHELYTILYLLHGLLSTMGAWGTCNHVCMGYMCHRIAAHCMCWLAALAV